MFDIGWSELVIIGIVALIAIGPKELPGVLRAIGQMMGKVRRTASDFQDQFREAMREAEVADLKQQFDDATTSATSGFTNPLEAAQKEVEKAFGSEPDPAAKPPADVATADPGAVEPSADAASATVHDFPAPDAPPVPDERPVQPSRPADIKPGGSSAA